MSWSSLTESVLGVCMATFGESVSYTPQGGAAATVTGVFTAEPHEVDPGTGLVVRSNQPVLGVQISALPDGAPSIGDSVTVRSVAYRVIDVIKDGEGGATLRLAKT